jgi:hypothetical protein
MRFASSKSASDKPPTSWVVKPRSTQQAILVGDLIDKNLAKLQ